MNSGRTVSAQLIQHLPYKQFHKCVARYRGDRYAKNFSCWDQYLAMAFAQLTYRESLRDIETCLVVCARVCSGCQIEKVVDELNLPKKIVSGRLIRTWRPGRVQEPIAKIRAGLTLEVTVDSRTNEFPSVHRRGPVCNQKLDLFHLSFPCQKRLRHSLLRRCAA